MNKKNYLSAFTIIEAVVSMAVTAIILTIIFVIFSIATENLFAFKKQNEAITDMNRMSYSINKSIFESRSMTIDENNLIFTAYSGKIIRYNISENYLTRNEKEFVDTFRLPIQQFRIDTLRNKNDREVYQRLHWVLNVDKQEIPFNFYKKVYTDELLKTIQKNEF